MKTDLWRTGTRTINGFRQFYREWKPRDSAYLPVLALHGSLAQSGMWIVPAEAAGSIHMLCPDQRGYGLSEDPGGDSCAEFASDALAIAQNLLPERYVVMGHLYPASSKNPSGHITACDHDCISADQYYRPLLNSITLTTSALKYVNSDFCRTASLEKRDE